ncbi:MAG: transketolase C-terminal domain-containing protein [Clostridium sp.]|nr:transketolase C-terminal domain-containing protein [Clostridium sp.]
MDLTKDNRMLSLLGQRGTFGTALYEMAKENENIVALSADLTRTSGLERFARNYQERFYNVGIAEANAVGMAAGLADKAKIPFVTTFSNFATLRANEFVRHFMAYMNCNVKLVGLGSGFAMELFGNTHYGLEDIAAVRSMPNIQILSPCDCMEVVKCVEYCVKHKGPIYLRLSGKAGNPIVNRKDYFFETGKGIVLTDGDDAVIYATGSMVSIALEAAKQLVDQNLYVKVINIHTIKPIDRELIIKNKDIPVILTIEEHSRIGGLGTAVSEILAETLNHGTVVRLGTGAQYKKAGRYDYMLAQHGLTVENLKRTIMEELKNDKFRKVQ